MAEVVLRGEGVPLTIHPGARVGSVLERRVAAVQGNHVWSGPGACGPVGIRDVAVCKRAAHPRTQRVADLVGKRSKERGLAGFLEMCAVNLNGCEVGLP